MKTMQKNYQAKQSGRFRYWSRKRYAMFFSLGRQVTIGCLAKGVLEIAVKKQKAVMMQPLFVQLDRQDMPADEGSGSLPGFFTLLAALLQPQVVVQAPCGASEEIKLINNAVHADGTRIRFKKPFRVPSVFMRQ